MSWLFLFLAGLCEVAWAVGLKTVSSGPWNIALTAVTLVLGMYLLALAVKGIPLGTAYAIWTGIGVIGTFVIGVIWFNEPVNAARIVSVMLILAGLTGLKLSCGH